MLALLILIVISMTIHGIINSEMSPEEVEEMLKSDEWY
jgi:hypothetical protein